MFSFEDIRSNYVTRSNTIQYPFKNVKQFLDVPQPEAAPRRTRRRRRGQQSSPVTPLPETETIERNGPLLIYFLKNLMFLVSINL